MKPLSTARHGLPAPSRRCLLVSALLSLAGCSALGPTTKPPPIFHSLDGPPQPAATGRPAPSAPVLAVTPTRAAPGYDSQRILYQRETNQLEYFANSEWVEPPARLLGPLLLAALERGGAFRAVVPAGGSAAADYRLDTELVRLQQDFLVRPSRVDFVMHATLVDDRTRSVVAVRRFSAVAVAATEDTRGGVLAASGAVQQLLAELAAFCAEAVAARGAAR